MGNVLSCCCCPGDEEQKTSYAQTTGAIKKKHKMKDNETKKQMTESEALNQFLNNKTIEEHIEYKIDGHLGSGRYAEVFKVVDLKQQKSVAIKVIDLKKSEENYRKNFLPEELKIIQKCKHNNIIKLYEICQKYNRVFMIMEFAPGGTIAELLRKKGVFNESTAHVMFAQIVSAVHHMHVEGIAHRDLKLENILLCNKDIPKISDFSFAIQAKHLKDGKSTQFCGSLIYFSPQILQTQPYDPFIYDIWSLGVCFYILLNDSTPFPVGNDKLMLKKQLNREWKFRTKVESKLSSNLKSMMSSMLEPMVEKRITSEALMSHPWIKES
jgi:serine/threonine protein kinase